jgi:hypothetical protein
MGGQWFLINIMALQSFSGTYWRVSGGLGEFVTVSGGKSVKDGVNTNPR